MGRKQIKGAMAAVAVGALAVAPTALAERPEGVGGGPPDFVTQGKPENPGSQGKGHGKGKSGGKATVMYVFKGTYAGNGAVDVVKGNAHVKRADLDGTTVNFDLSSAKLSVADTDASGVVDLADVATGDKVVVKARLPRTEPGSQPFVAKQLVDQTHPAPSS